MDMIAEDIEIKEPKLSEALEEQIDRDIETSESEIDNGEFMDAHEGFRLLREKHGFI